MDDQTATDRPTEGPDGAPGRDAAVDGGSRDVTTGASDTTTGTDDVAGDGAAAPTSQGTSEFRASVDDASAELLAFLAADRATKVRFIGDLVALAPLVATFVWMSAHDGGFEPLYGRYLIVIALVASPLAALELRHVPIWPRRLLAWWGVGLLLVWLLAGERNFWVHSSQVLGLTPVLGLLAHRLWRRPWGPLALFGVLLVSFGAFTYGAFLAWWGDTLVGRVPIWRPLSWHIQSGALMGAFAAAFLAAAYASRTTIAAISVAASGTAFATAWLSGSRGAIVATGLAAAVVTLAAIRGRHVRAVATRAGATVLVAVAVFGGLVAMEPDDALTGAQRGASRSIPSERIEGRSIEAGESFSRRLLHMDAALGMFVDRPVRGQGIGSYRVRSLVFTDPDARLTSSAHNEYVEMLGEGGLLFGLPFVALAGLIGIAALRRRIEPADAPSDAPDLRATASAAGIGLVALVGLHSATDFDWFYPILPGLLAVGAVFVGGRHGSDDEPARLRTVAWGIPFVVALAGIAIGGAAEARANAGAADLTAEQYAEVPMPWQGERGLQIGLDLARADEHELAEGLFDEIVAWNPAVDDYRVLRASVRYRAGEIDAEELVLALADSNAQFRVFNLIAEALIDEGDVDLARGVLDAVLSRYDEYENWGVGGVRGESWYLVVRADVVAGACELAEQDAEEAVASGAYALDDAEAELEPLLASCDPGTPA